MWLLLSIRYQIKIINTEKYNYIKLWDSLKKIEYTNKKWWKLYF